MDKLFTIPHLKEKKENPKRSSPPTDPIFVSLRTAFLALSAWSQGVHLASDGYRLASSKVPETRSCAIPSPSKAAPLPGQAPVSFIFPSGLLGHGSLCCPHQGQSGMQFRTAVATVGTFTGRGSRNRKKNCHKEIICCICLNRAFGQT